MTCPDALSYVTHTEPSPQPSGARSPVQVTPGWSYLCDFLLKDKGNLGVRFGIQLIKGFKLISNHANFPTREPHTHPCPGNWGSRKKCVKERSHPRPPGCISRHVNPPNHGEKSLLLLPTGQILQGLWEGTTNTEEMQPQGPCQLTPGAHGADASLSRWAHTHTHTCVSIPQPWAQC